MATAKNPMLQIVQELSERDSRLAAVIASHPLCPLGVVNTQVSNFASLVESVVSQQLSVKAADTIHDRLLDLANRQILPVNLLRLSDEDMRACGLSAAKTKTIRGLAEASASGAIDFDSLHELEDDERISTMLNSLWGIGPWTVDMFMMHQLGRLDVWPTGDLGVRRGWARIYDLNENIEAKELIPAGDKFRPYRSVVAWYCWRATG